MELVVGVVIGVIVGVGGVVVANVLVMGWWLREEAERRGEPIVEHREPTDGE